MTADTGIDALINACCYQRRGAGVSSPLFRMSNTIHMVPGLLCFLIVTLIFSLAGALHAQFWDIPPPPPPHQYGNILLDRLSTANDVKPVFFSHWSHRIRYTCRVCHLELGFSFVTGETEITEKENQSGMFCGACHEGETAFGHTEKNCDRCHTGDASSSREEFRKKLKSVPKALDGDTIDWVRAIASGAINPLYSIFDKDAKPLGYDTTLELQAEWKFVPPAVFPHGSHVKWLDCANCHPDIFNIKKKSTEHFEMKYILEKKFCGVCHFSVAFPLNDCRACHPGMKQGEFSGVSP